MIKSLKSDLQQLANKEKAQLLMRFFKTGEGHYAEGDIFIGVTVPNSHLIANKYKTLPLDQVEKLLHSPIHEERLIALFILVDQFKKAEPKTQTKIYNLYLKNTDYINNWDLVDSSAHKIVGEYLLDKDSSILIKLAQSKDLWQKRIAMIATYKFILHGRDAETYQIAQLLLYDKHDLIHKAVGWMLREAGKRVSQKNEEEFLKKYHKVMPRTMLRYAIEHFPEDLRRAYIEGRVK